MTSCQLTRAVGFLTDFPLITLSKAQEVQSKAFSQILKFTTPAFIQTHRFSFMEKMRTLWPFSSPFGFITGLLQFISNTP
jgi:hypothetical protein